MNALESTVPERAPAVGARAAPLAGPQNGPSSTQRRYELDWLRSLAVFGLIPFHAAIVFTTGSRDYVKSGQTSAVMDVFASFITFWGIPLIFLIGGAAAYFALRVRSPGAYVRARLTRLGIPFLVGILTIVPIQVYIGTLSGPGAPLSYPAFYLSYLTRWVNLLHGSFPTAGAEWIGHLWFIPPLIVYSLLALPFSRLLRKAWCARLFERAAVAARGWRVLFVFGVPVALSEYVLRAGVSRPLSFDFQFSDAWAGFVFYFIFFLYGYIIYSDVRLMRGVRQYGMAALVLGVVSWITLQVIHQTHLGPAYDYSLGYGLYMLLRSYISWFLVMAILGLGMRYLNRRNRLLDYLNEATYPIYLLHMPVLTIVAYYVVRWRIGFFWEFLAVVVITIVVTVLLYDLLVRRIGVLRFLFGVGHRVSTPSGDTVSHEPHNRDSSGNGATLARSEPDGKVAGDTASAEDVGKPVADDVTAASGLLPPDASDSPARDARRVS